MRGRAKRGVVARRFGRVEAQGRLYDGWPRHNTEPRSMPTRGGRTTNHLLRAKRASLRSLCRRAGTPKNSSKRAAISAINDTKKGRKFRPNTKVFFEDKLMAYYQWNTANVIVKNNIHDVITAL